jgi:hypothetical protein
VATRGGAALAAPPPHLSPPRHVLISQPSWAEPIQYGPSRLLEEAHHHPFRGLKPHGPRRTPRHSTAPLRRRRRGGSSCPRRPPSGHPPLSLRGLNPRRPVAGGRRSPPSSLPAAAAARGPVAMAALAARILRRGPVRSSARLASIRFVASPLTGSTAGSWLVKSPC